MPRSKRGTEDRLFFITKSWLMGQIAGVVFLVVVLILGSINFWQAFFLNAFLFVFSLVVARLFERKIDRTVLWIDRRLDGFPRLKRMIKNRL